MQKGFKFRIYPNKEQSVFLAKHFGCSRYIYNYALDQKIKTYEKTGKSISCFDIIKQLPELKEQTGWLREINSQSLQSSVKHVETAFTKFFREKTGFPKFKSKKRNKHSFSVPQHYKVKEGKIFIPKLKSGIKLVQHRKIKGVMKTLTISQTPSGKYYATILVDTPENIIKPKRLIKTKTIGIDVGIKDFCTISTGEKVENPKHLAKSEKKLKRAQQRHSKKQAGSNNKSKSRTRVARIHEKVTNQRNDFLHKLSSKIVGENQSICVEDLGIRSMMQNKYLAKSIGSVGWGEFKRQLIYKSEWYGKNLIEIGRFEPSSQICNHCGQQNTALKLSDRAWTCGGCKHEHDRDINASKNIKDFGIEKYRRNYGNLRLLDTTKVAKSE